MSAAAAFRDAARARILIKDGPYGTAIQNYGLAEEDYRGDLSVTHDQKGNNDLLNLTRPDIVAAICDAYADAGADILATNTFNANRISQADYGLEDEVVSINTAAAHVVRASAARAEARDGRRRFVAGAIGPTNKTLSLSPDVNDPGFRAVDFDEMKAVYAEQARALIDGGCDFVLVETIFDTLNAKAAIMAVLELEAELGREVPMMISMTVTDMSGRNLSGHSVEAFWYTVRHAKPLTMGLNCAFGADLLRPHVQALSPLADTLVMVYPNAGLPNDLGEYDEQPATTAGFIADWVADGLVNIVGGCCGSTPAHIAAMAGVVAGKRPRAVPSPRPRLQLSGLDPMLMDAA